MRLILLFLIAALLAGCGGGGGGGGLGNVAATGRIIWLSSGTGPNPPATVQIGNLSAQTDTGGNFQIAAPAGSTSLLVVYQPVGGSAVTFRFDIPPLQANQDLGDFYIGPEKITVTGRVLSAVDGSAIPGASVRFAGRMGVTDASGRFNLPEVAYDSGNVAAFLGLEGRVTKTGFFARDFFPSAGAVAGVVTIEDLSLSPEGGTSPPGNPANIEGFISPAGSAPGTVVKLLQNGTPVRQFTVGSDAHYGFFVVAGSYVIQYHNLINGLSAPDESVTLAGANQVVRRDVTLR